MPSYPPGFYVYMLVDPKNGVPFYVGKGQRMRAWQHAAAVGRGDFTGNTRKVTKIQEILARGEEVEIQIVAQYELEDDALEHEFELVDSNPELTNVMPGGGGGPGGRRLTEEEIRQRISARIARIKKAQELARRERHGKAVARHSVVVKDHYLKLARNEQQAKEINHWLKSRGKLVKVQGSNGICREALRDANGKLGCSANARRKDRAAREDFLVKTGKLVPSTDVRFGKYRLQSSERCVSTERR